MLVMWLFFAQYNLILSVKLSHILDCCPPLSICVHTTCGLLCFGGSPVVFSLLVFCDFFFQFGDWAQKHTICNFEQFQENLIGSPRLCPLKAEFVSH